MLLAAGEISDWIEGVVWLLIIGGSVLAGVAKPLIKKFGFQVLVAPPSALYSNQKAYRLP